MAVKYLAGNRIVGTAAERTALTIETSRGCSGLSGATPSITTGVIRSTKLTASASVTIASIQATLTSVGGNVILSIYSDDSDSPDALLATTGSVTQVEGLNNYDLTTPYAVTATTDYWIAIQVDYNITTIGGTGASNANTYANQSFSAPSTFPSAGTDDTGFQFCIYSSAYPNLSNGIIFEESDTGKHHMFDGTNTWNEVA